jgi:cardiolipin synthase
MTPPAVIRPLFVRQTPNLLSALRLMAAPLAAWLIISAHSAAALCVFAVAALSDGLDGFFARRWGVTSRLGAGLDPSADKLLMLLCYVALLAVGAAPWWLVALVIARDLAITSGWLVARVLAWPLRREPLSIGKATTLVQIAYIGAWLLILAFDQSWPVLMMAAAWTTAIFTLTSGLAYALLFLGALIAGRRSA